jgi:hypothetical protein
LRSVRNNVCGIADEATRFLRYKLAVKHPAGAQAMLDEREALAAKPA